MEREEIKNLLESARDGVCFGRKLLEVGAYSYKGDIEGYIAWKGQEVDEIVVNKKYDMKVDFTHLCNAGKYDIDTAVDIAKTVIDYLVI